VRAPRRARMKRAQVVRSGWSGVAVALLLSPMFGAAAQAKSAKEAKEGKEAKGAAKAPAAAKEDPVARGGYIVAHSGCNDCHTPWMFNKDLGLPMPDMTRMLSGHPANGPEPSPKLDPKIDLAFIAADFTTFRLPFGLVYSANLTPDKETGLGNWSEQMFVNAMRKGLHMGVEGRPILPPMPWPEVRNLTDEDLKAVFAFLQSIPAVHNPVPDPKVPKPVLDGLLKSRPKLLEMLDAGHKH
jgi:mono/diheme cytochrome c family protein